MVSLTTLLTTFPTFHHCGCDVTLARDPELAETTGTAYNCLLATKSRDEVSTPFCLRVGLDGIAIHGKGYWRAGSRFAPRQDFCCLSGFKSR